MWIAICTIAFIVIIVALSAKCWCERVKCKAVIYYMVDNGCTAPTESDMERCIRIVTEKTVNELFKR